jgi:serine O-acetyltransferase
VTEVDDDAARLDLRRQIRSEHPGLFESLVEDARVTRANRAERYEFTSRADAIANVLRLAWSGDAFLAQLLYRVQAWLQARGVPFLPRIAHRLSMAIAQVSIGESTVVEPGLYLLHGQVVVDGFSRIGRRVVIGPFVTIGLRAGDIKGPTISSDVSIGTGAKLIGPIHVGTGASIGANAVVVDDVAPGTTVVGAPARPTSASAEASVAAQDTDNLGT